MADIPFIARVSCPILVYFQHSSRVTLLEHEFAYVTLGPPTAFHFTLSERTMISEALQDPSLPLPP